MFTEISEIDSNKHIWLTAKLSYARRGIYFRDKLNKDSHIQESDFLALNIGTPIPKKFQLIQKSKVICLERTADRAKEKNFTYV